MAKLLLAAICMWSVFCNTANGQDCSSAMSCDQCVQRHSSCGWCTLLNSAARPRCQTVNEHIGSRDCLAENIVSPSSSVLRPTPSGMSATSGRQLVDLTADRSGNINLNLRAGDSATFDVKVVRQNNFPVDLYYILDTTGTMAFNLGNLQLNGPNIIASLGNLTSTRRIGLGTFSDKPTAPYFNQLRNGSLYQTDQGVECGATSQVGIITPCGNPNSFTHLLELTDNVADFSAAADSVKLVQKSVADGRRKSQLEAVLQAAVCEQIVGWSRYVRGDSIRLIILATDGEYHSAGDGVLAGILASSDGTCGVDANTGEYLRSKNVDYPSTGQVKVALEENEVLVMFAVARAGGVDNPSPAYENLARQWAGRAFTSTLRDGDNVGFVNLVVDSTRLASEQAILRLAGTNRDGVVMTARATCPGGSPVNAGESVERCAGVSVGLTATFEVTLTAQDCSRLQNSKNLELFVSPAYGIVNITINPLCSCPCTSMSMTDSPSCSDLGNLTCGQCECPRTNPGSTCKCDLAMVNEVSNVERDCRPPNATAGDLPCSGQGNCGVTDECRYGCTSCSPGFHGKYCQCRNSLCRLANNGEACGGLGQGRCQCNELTCTDCNCTCFEPYTLDDVCNLCNPSDATCRATPNSPICSNNGRCTCGACNCTGDWTGATCTACAQGQQCVSAVCGRAAPCIDAPETCLNGSDCYLCTGASRVSTTVSGTGCVKHFCPSIILLRTSPGSNYLFLDPLNNVTIGDLCVTQDGNCQRTFYSAVNSQEQLVGLAVVELNTDKDCSEAFNSLPVVLGIVLGLVGLAILLLVVWKIATFVLDRREYRRFLEAQKDAKWEKESNPLFKSPTQTFVNPDYKGQQK